MNTKKAISTNESEIIIKKTTAVRIVTVMISLILGGISLLYMFGAYCLSFDYKCVYGFSSNYTFIINDVLLIIANALFIIFAFGILFGIIGKINRNILNVSFALASIISTLIFFYNFISIISVPTGLGTEEMFVRLAAVHIVYAALVFLVLRFVGFFLLKKLKAIN